ncbi:MAG: insulinase family protein [Pyrinomonadaceae bacterium]|nr:insulinase family protein [Pyrinomonadaceae bacterium]
MSNSKFKIFAFINIFGVLLSAFSFSAKAQELPPAPSAPRVVKIPAVKEVTLSNKLKIAVVERKNVPLVTVRLLIKNGASVEEDNLAGLANMTAELLTKGTKTRTATQIAEQMEFLGGSIETGANWNSTDISVNVLADKLDAAMAIMADILLNPAFAPKEIELLKTQTIDNLNYNLKQPGVLANYVASRYSFDEHAASGTPESIARLKRLDITNFKRLFYNPDNAVLIFTGDITAAKAAALAKKYFGVWRTPTVRTKIIQRIHTGPNLPTIPARETEIVKNLLVVDLPNAGQAAVVYARKLYEGRLNCPDGNCQASEVYYPANVLNSVLGGGYSSRLNQEIRIKRGLSYGAGSSFAWRGFASNFATRTQTKNESAAEVASLVAGEINRLTADSIANSELVPRKAVLTGDFGRDLATNNGLAEKVAELYSYDLKVGELNSYMNRVNTVSDQQIKDFAGANLRGGDIIIVGDYAKFKDDLAKRFPNTKIDVIKADELDLSKENLRK